MKGDIEFYGDSISGNCYKLQRIEARPQYVPMRAVSGGHQQAAAGVDLPTG